MFVKLFCAHGTFWNVTVKGRLLLKRRDQRLRHIYKQILTCIARLSLYIVVFIQTGATPVYKASENGHTAVVDTLVEAKADLNLPNNVSTFLLLANSNPRLSCAARVIVVLVPVFVCLFVCLASLARLPWQLQLFNFYIDRLYMANQ